MDQAEQKTGPLIGTIIIIALLLLGGYYLWKSTSGTPAPTGQATSDEVVDLEATAAAMNLNGLDTGLGDIEKELNQP